MASGLELHNLYSPFQSKPLSDSVISHYLVQSSFENSQGQRFFFNQTFATDLPQAAPGPSHTTHSVLWDVSVTLHWTLQAFLASPECPQTAQNSPDAVQVGTPSLQLCSG